MPIIISDSAGLHPSLSEDQSLVQLDDEESFVVLERSTANGEEIIVQENSQFYQSSPVSFSFPVFNNVVSSGMASSRTPHLNQPMPEPDASLINFQLESNHSSVNVKELEEHLKVVIEENKHLKDIVCQTNLAMKQQLKTVSLMQDRALETHKNHQEKFADTKALVLQLKEENKGLKVVNETFENEMSTLKEENKALKVKNEAFENELSKLNGDIKQLKESNAGFGSEVTKLMTENDALKKYLTSAKQAVQNTSESSKIDTSSEKLVEEIGTLRSRLKSTEEALKTLQLASENGKVAAAELLAENKILKNRLVSAEESLQLANDSEKKTVSQESAKEMELHELVGDLTKKLEMVERVRRNHEFSLDRLQAQLGRVNGELTDTQRKLAHSENTIQALQSLKSERSFHSGHLLAYKELLKQLEDLEEAEHNKVNSIGSWLNLTLEPGNLDLEISELRRLLQEEQDQSVSRKASLQFAVTLLSKLLDDYKHLEEELEKVRADYAVKQSHSIQYDEMQKKGYQERLDALTAKLVLKEEALASSERHYASLQEAVRLQNSDKPNNEEVKVLTEQVQNLTDEVNAKQDEINNNRLQIDSLKNALENAQATRDTMMVLEEQAKIYQVDFEAERKAREELVAEKERILVDMRFLMKRNEELLKEIQQANRRGEDPNESSTSSRRTPSPPTLKFVCPNSDCKRLFGTLEEVHRHVIACWDLQDVWY